MPKSTPGKVLTFKQAAKWAANARKKRQSIVATNGCFDLLHYGHIRYLQRAKRSGDLLVVGLNGDSSVRQLKGPERPLVPQKFRAAVLAALECVDAVVIFPEMRAHRFLAAIRPDIYVKGGDYSPESLNAEERATLTALGTRVRLLPFEKGFSTTSIVKKIRDEARRGKG